MQHIVLEMAEIEIRIYGNSKDSFDNSQETQENTDKVLNNRHSLNGLQDRVHATQDSCRYADH